MRKLTKQQIKEIKESTECAAELSRKFKVHPNVIRYYKSEEFRNYLREYQRERYRKMTKEQKRTYFDKKKDYQKNYQSDKYNNDESFREKQLERARQYQRKKYVKKSSIGKEKNMLKGGVK